MEFFFAYALFLLKLLTCLLLACLPLLCMRKKAAPSPPACTGTLTVTPLADYFEDMQHTLHAALLDKSAYRRYIKAEKKKKQAEKKAEKRTPPASSTEDNPLLPASGRLFVLDFQGDLRASEVASLRHCITAIIASATPQQDRVLVRLNSGGGMVHEYGLAASQLQRLKEAGIGLTVCIDKVAASGGYLMACVADTLLAAPFAVIGSIGVIKGVPNFSGLLQEKKIEYQQVTAGKHKRTLNIFSPNTPEGIEKAREEVAQVHMLFKQFVQKNRPQVQLDKVDTGEHWYASDAHSYGLVDRLMTSDDYLLTMQKTWHCYHLHYALPTPSLWQRMTQSVTAFSGLLTTLIGPIFGRPTD